MKERIVNNSIGKKPVQRRVSTNKKNINFKEKAKYFLIGALAVVAIYNVDNVMDGVINAFEKDQAYQQQRVEDYYESVGTSLEEVIENAKPESEREVVEEYLTEEEQMIRDIEEQLKQQNEEEKGFSK